MAFRADFRSGSRTVLPLLPPAATVALAVGVAGPLAGLTTLQTVSLSVLTYFPSVMLTALELIDAAVPTLVVLVSSLVVGIRVIVLSLSIAPYFSRFSTRWKWLLAYFLWTPVYALTIERYAGHPEADVRGYYLGMALPLWITVQLSVLAGTAVSSSVPAGLELGYIVPLAFIALVRSFLTDTAAKVVAVTAGVIAVVGSVLPFGMGIIVGTLGGVVAGMAVRWKVAT